MAALEKEQGSIPPLVSSLLAGKTPKVGGPERNTQRFTDMLHGGAGGEKGIRTLETVPRLHTFQACAFDHSAISPHRL